MQGGRSRIRRDGQRANGCMRIRVRVGYKAGGRREAACLNLDLAFPADFITVRAVAPPLDEIAGAGTPGQLETRCCSGFGSGQLGSGLERGGRPSERVCFPLCGTKRMSKMNYSIRISRGHARRFLYLRVLFWLVLACRQRSRQGGWKEYSYRLAGEFRDRAKGAGDVTCGGYMLVVQLVKLTDMGIMTIRVCEPPLTVL